MQWLASCLQTWTHLKSPSPVSFVIWGNRPHQTTTTITPRAEFYAYAELPDVSAAQEMFDAWLGPTRAVLPLLLERHAGFNLLFFISQGWSEADERERKLLVGCCLDGLESTSEVVRLRSAQRLLYIALGNCLMVFFCF